MTGPTDAVLDAIERIETGRPLDDLWPQLTDEERAVLEETDQLDEAEIPWAE